MNKKLLTSTLLAASLLAAPAVAFAQSESAAPATNETTTEATAPKVVHHHMASGTHFRAGTTTGLGSTSEGRARPGGQSVARKGSGS